MASRTRIVALALAVALGGSTVASVAIADPSVPAAQRRANIKKRIQALRAAQLTTALDLDSQTAAKLTAVLDKYDDETDALVQKRVEVTRKLNQAANDKDAEHAVDEAIANQKAFRDLEDRRLADIRKVLTAKQVAKLLVVLPEFERRIQNQLRKAIQNANTQQSQQPKHTGDDDEVE
jgi:Spy/CpxP family protein refolding chaperone|nr:hypothetical protein [Kofleriaceae bacterium]